MNRRGYQLLSLVFIVAAYYATQWAADVVQITSLLPLGQGLATVRWVESIDHHLVQLLLALGAIWYLSDGDWKAWGLNLWNRSKSWRWLTRGFLPVLVGFLFLGELLVPILTGNPPTFDYALTPLNVAGMVLFMGVVSGLSEEILFRGFVQTYLSRYFESSIPVFDHELPVAGLVAAILFTIAHVGFTLSPIAVYHFRPSQLVLAFVLGIYYAIVYHDTDSLLAPILAHNAVNGSIVVATFLSAWYLGQF